MSILLIMDFSEYQKEAKKTIQKYNADETSNIVIPYLGIIGEAGSVVSELKKRLRDGKSYSNFKNKLKEELGDVLWYISAIASQNGISLEDIAQENIKKIEDRFVEDSCAIYKDFDKDYPEEESLPEEFQVAFIPFESEGKNLVKIVDYKTKELIGDPLSDNNYEDDGYRFHDIFHYGYLANLGWSPVVRKLLKRKRKSNPEIDENEDGARAQIIEEIVSLLIYSESKNHQLLKYSKNIDTTLLGLVQRLVKTLEVKECTAKQWETAILNSYKVFNELIENNGGRVLVSKKNRRLIYLGKN
ncbi:nucleoside triphosphate pyrophosphohydrolase family protein [Winogradskyella sp. SYSU M77433]|uniref:nucleoside triphosphate pyrophosphohydrolase family protein n=1 Tax=Winogradskyella sp. SYSU M77433 TaxID=3042722 RepID=UPI0024815F96|nr:nucleoside triphosphate pyrophosphohydrolase family protein [Winogradskyella sp. SYSU M77433]MDH7912077.1 nucleoside triphosphate pyrophosphohydrolase family protein [Winogradskyella sp. SYSU M77433]